MNLSMEKMILEILLNVIHRADMSHLTERDLDQIHHELTGKGYQYREISMVLNWLMAQSIENQKVVTDQVSTDDHFRVLNPMEQSFLKPDAQGLLYEISTSGIVNHDELENIIQQITWFGQGNLDRNDLEELLEVMYSLADPTSDEYQHLFDNGTIH